MKRMNGFTLVELIGVIVLLAIIAVIAFPTVETIIEDARKDSFVNSAYGIIKSGNLYYSRKDMLGEMNNYITFTFPNNAEELELDGKLPKKGSMVISQDGDIAIALSNGRYCITKAFEDADITVTEDDEICKLPKIPNPNISSTSECVKSGTCSTNEIKTGVLVNVKVNETENYDFFVISDTGEELTLIMDKNLGDNVAWISKADYNDNAYYGDYGNTDKGPITALNYLNSQTANWTNIEPIKSYTYDNSLNANTNKYGYQKLEITNGEGTLNGTTKLTGISRARLLTYGEASGLKTPIDNTTPVWLYTNLNGSDKPDAPHGYWFLTTYPAYSYASRNMRSDGYVDDYNGAYVDTSIGVRPVITISKSIEVLL